MRIYISTVCHAAKINVSQTLVHQLNLNNGLNIEKDISTWDLVHVIVWLRPDLPFLPSYLLSESTVASLKKKKFHVFGEQNFCSIDVKTSGFDCLHM